MGSTPVFQKADPEKVTAATVQTTAPSAGTEATPNLVTWDGPTDANNPKNWPFSKRWRMTAISSAFAFISPVTTSMTAPALTTIAQDLHIHSAFERQLTLSAFILAYAIGPLLAAPLSEVYGRQPIVQIFNMFFLAFNIACGFAATGSQLIVCRFFAGFGGSAAAVIGAGVLGDVWRNEERGLSVGIYTLITLLSPTLGPLLGGFITEYSSWRWTFWTISIADACIQLVALLFFRETFAPVLLARKVQTLRKETGNQALHTKWERADVTFKRRVQGAFARPFLMLITQPICQVFALYGFYTFGLVYLALATFAEIWTSEYHESVSISGLNYLALALGYIIGTQSCSRLIEIVYKRLQNSRGGDRKPEYRLPLLIPGAFLVPIGLLWYGWSTEKHLHWIMPDIGMVIFGMGVKFTTQCQQLYALDVYPTYAASASAQAMFIRSLSGFAFPVFAPYLYQSLGYGWGNSVLAILAVVIGVPAPFFLWFYGPSLRRKSEYSTG